MSILPDPKQFAAAKTNYHSGLAAEAAVARQYSRRGLRPVAERWRSAGGEIDLIFRDGDSVVFVEVKSARSHSEAATRIGPRQIARLHRSAACFLGGEPKGELTEARFDLALVDRNGAIEILENAFM